MIYNDDVKLIREMIDNINELSKKGTKHEENIIEYKYIPHDLTKLPFDIYIDDGNSYKNHKHPLWLYILKNDTLIPITIEQEPKVVEGEITKSEYISISEFICKYLKLLQDIADDLVDSSILNNNLQQQYRLVVENDNRGLLIEMARIRKDITGLPCDIYVDNGPIHSGHEGSPHIKFPPNNECKYSTEFASMSISANPDFFPDNKAKFDSIVKAKLKRKVQVFIRELYRS